MEHFALSSADPYCAFAFLLRESYLITPGEQRGWRHWPHWPPNNRLNFQGLSLVSSLGEDYTQVSTAVPQLFLSYRANKPCL